MDNIRVAVFDIGTNTALCLVLEGDHDGNARVVLDRHAIARLGEGVDKSRLISDVAFDRFAVVMREHLAAIASLDVDKVVAVGTSALRDATNREQILYRAKKEIGIDIEIISGSEEASLTYRGALLGMDLVSHDIGVLDIGGGSTEFAIGGNGLFQHGNSLNIGAVRMTERYFSGAAPFDVAPAKRSIRQALSDVKQILPKGRPLVAVAGTPTSLAGMDLRLTAFDASRILGHALKKELVQRLVGELATTPLEEMMARYPVIAKGRADILLAGSLILLETIEMLQLNEVQVSTRGLRYGIAIEGIEHEHGLPQLSWKISG